MSIISHLLFTAEPACNENSAGAANTSGLLAGAAKVDITNREAGPVNDALYVKALVLKNDTTTAVLITVDAVALVVHFLIPYRVEVVPDHRFHRSGTDATLHEFTGRTTRTTLINMSVAI